MARESLLSSGSAAAIKAHSTSGEPLSHAFAEEPFLLLADLIQISIYHLSS